MAIVVIPTWYWYACTYYVRTYCNTYVYVYVLIMLRHNFLVRTYVLQYKQGVTYVRRFYWYYHYHW
jgi:hypothetical protein